MDGMYVKLSMIGPWSISGLIARSDDRKLIIEDDSGTHIIFRDKIVIASIISKKEYEGEKGHNVIIEKKSVESEQSFPMNELNYTEQFFGLPKTLLKGSKLVDDSEDNDLSVSFKRTESSSSGLVFRSDDDTSE
jgi:hypothetical protein